MLLFSHVSSLGLPGLEKKRYNTILIEFKKNFWRNTILEKEKKFTRIHLSRIYAKYIVTSVSISKQELEKMFVSAKRASMGCFEVTYLGKGRHISDALSQVSFFNTEDLNVESIKEECPLLLGDNEELSIRKNNFDTEKLTEESLRKVIQSISTNQIFIETKKKNILIETRKKKRNYEKKTPRKRMRRSPSPRKEGETGEEAISQIVGEMESEGKTINVLDEKEVNDILNYYKSFTE